ncbi:GGDEF domain-containing protein [Bacillus sp. HMF5848]|uniref:GGDEF domain-containing protein n=1 Tax=Bacillus sp. HMF5848 TaxID=2495421 RepID=UPI000F7886A6|nr:GGDEF domain-containing protein [Bacillus sp. HMF5848]RSK25800.1 GGDEF domain-containing protein [Bacillus sp. HMF5848]
MQYLVQFQINIFALMILIVLYLFIRMRSKIESFGKMLLRMILIASAVAIVIEPLTWIFDGMQFVGAFFLEYLTNFILFMMGPLLGGLMLAYVDYCIFKDPKRILKRRFYQDVSILTFAALIVNIFYPFYFHVNPVTNSFSSGEYKWIHYVVLASLYIYMLFFVIKNRKRTKLYIVSIFVLFFMLPIIGMLVQLIDSKLYFSWTSIVLGILVAYIFLETSSTEVDYLTKVYNRHSYESYLKHLIETDKKFAVIFIDIDKFKDINDQHGHDIGDQVLIVFAQVLGKVFHSNSLVFRLGGDEFIVVVESTDTNADYYISKIQALLKDNPLKYMNQLRFSYGCQQYSEKMTIDELYIKVDKEMYANKHTDRIG